MKIAIKFTLAIVSLAFLVGCGPNIDDAKKLGFESVEQMKDLQSRGYKTKKDFLELEAPFAWIKKQREFCKDYAEAPNEIKKSSIFRSNEALLSGASVKNGKGTLSSIKTDKGGTFLDIQIIAGGEIRFNTANILIGSNVYKQIENLREKSCVVFSASKIRAGSVLEKSSVCDLHYIVEFTNVEACK
jgi:hypothetical protein